jgi:hypothetical protein
MTYRDYAYFNRPIPNEIKGNLSFQVPITQRAVEQVFLIIRNNDELQDITKAGKLSSYWPLTRVISRANIRINGIKRYGEDLDNRGMLMELQRLNPQTKMSELFQDEWRDWSQANQIAVWSCQMDYSKDLLSAIKTASQTSPLIIDIQWSNNFNPLSKNLNFELIVQYVKWFSVTREQIQVID